MCVHVDGCVGGGRDAAGVCGGVCVGYGWVCWWAVKVLLGQMRGFDMMPCVA